MFTKEETDRIGLRPALLRTADHVENAIGQSRGKKNARELDIDRKNEAKRLRQLAEGLTPNTLP